jgi:hypothetical protein
LAAAAPLVLAGYVKAQTVPDIGFDSVGRGAPMVAALPTRALRGPADLPAALQDQPVVGPLTLGGVGPDGAAIDSLVIGAAWNGAAPDGVTPLAVDIFTSQDFYRDRALWSDPRYFRCNSNTGLESQWGALQTMRAQNGDAPPGTAAWGHCDRDYPREAIVSPYPFETAQAHYEALLEETRGRGGPTTHSYASVPGEWSGRYAWRSGATETWFGFMFWSQIPTILSLLTPEYQTRAVQELYHEGATNAPQWPAQYCWPEGFMRRWSVTAAGPHAILVTPSLVQIRTGNAGNFVTDIHIGREFNMDGAVPRLGADVPRWYGETIGFWDGDTLITWTSNVQGWKTHGAFEFSNRMQTIEIYTPNRDAEGNFTGLNHESVFYDPEALVEPVRIVRNLAKMSGFEEGEPQHHIECVQTIYPVDGVATPLSPGATIANYEVPDMFGRPWADIWEEYHETGMQRPETEDIFGFD